MNVCKVNQCQTSDLESACVAAIVLGVLAAILLILLGVAITGWVCTYWTLKKKLKQNVKNNPR